MRELIRADYPAAIDEMNRELTSTPPEYGRIFSSGRAVSSRVTRQGGPAIVEEHRHLLTAVMALPEVEAQVMALHFFDDHAVPVVASMLGRPVNTVTKQLSRADARLRAALEGQRPRLAARGAGESSGGQRKRWIGSKTRRESATWYLVQKVLVQKVHRHPVKAADKRHHPTPALLFLLSLN